MGNEKKREREIVRRRARGNVVFLPIFEVVCTSFDSRERLFEKYPESISHVKQIETKRRWIEAHLYFHVDAIFLEETLLRQEEEEEGREDSDNNHDEKERTKEEDEEEREEREEREE